MQGAVKRGRALSLNLNITRSIVTIVLDKTTLLYFSFTSGPHNMGDFIFSFLGGDEIFIMSDRVIFR